MKKMKYFTVCLILCVLFLTGCGNDEEKTVEGSGFYYLNTEGTGIVKKKYSIRGDNLEESIERLLEEMQKETDSIEYNSPFPKGVEIEKWEVSGSMLDIYFNVNYNKLDSATKVLLRASLIQTLTQIQDVEYVSFYAAGQPITDGSGNEIGYQSEEDFVQNIGSTLHSYQKGELTLYFANKDGMLLKESQKSNIRYNANCRSPKTSVRRTRHSDRLARRFHIPRTGRRALHSTGCESLRERQIHPKNVSAPHPPWNPEQTPRSHRNTGLFHEYTQ